MDPILFQVKYYLVKNQIISKVPRQYQWHFFKLYAVQLQILSNFQIIKYNLWYIRNWTTGVNRTTDDTHFSNNRVHQRWFARTNLKTDRKFSSINRKKNTMATDRQLYKRGDFYSSWETKVLEIFVKVSLSMTKSNS